MDSSVNCQVLIVGGGAAGLWLLDELRSRRITSLLVDTARLGTGQTSLAQGILHAGTRYSLDGVFSSAAQAVSRAAERWHAPLDGKAEPDLSRLRLRAPFCYLWRNDSWRSWLGLMGAQAALRTRPAPLAEDERPAPLVNCPGKVFRLDEPVIDPVHLLALLRERNSGFILQGVRQSAARSAGHDDQGRIVVTVEEPNGDRKQAITADWLVLTAGTGNEAWRSQLGLPSGAMQRRPLHVVMLRGDLPTLNGHCVDGSRTRVTVTSDIDAQGRTVWQLGGQVTEDGVTLEPATLIRHARQELEAVLPGWQLPPVEWATVKVDRAEAKTSDGSRPDNVQVLMDGNVITAWPTKLVLVPLLVERIAQAMPLSAATLSADKNWPDFERKIDQLAWPRPDVAKHPWEQDLEWIKDH